MDMVVRTPLQAGGPQKGRIRLAVPDGREVEVGRTPKQDVGYADLTFAADGAFKRARRRLQAWFRFRDETRRHELGQPFGDKRLRRAQSRFSKVCA